MSGRTRERPRIVRAGVKPGGESLVAQSADQVQHEDLVEGELERLVEGEQSQARIELGATALYNIDVTEIGAFQVAVMNKFRAQGPEGGDGCYLAYHDVPRKTIWREKILPLLKSLW